MSKFTPMTAERFWNKVDKSGGPDACWTWTGFIDRNGYGITTVNYFQTRSHRIAWMFTYGEKLPKSVFLCHKCDNPACCNPAHLFKGDAATNAADMVSKGRQSKGDAHSKAILPGRKRGENHYAHRYTESDVRRMIELRSAGVPMVDIYREFNGSKGTIEKIIQRRTWKHLDIPKPPNKPFSKLSDDQVREMRLMREQWRTPIKALAAHFGVTVWCVNDVIYRRTRTNI